MAEELRESGLAQATFFSALVDGALAVATLATTPYLVRCLGPEPYGILGMVGVIAGQLSMLQLGIGAATMRRVAECRGRQDVSQQADTLRAAWALGLASAALVATAFVVVFPWAWDEAFKATEGVLHEARSSLFAAAAVVAAQPLLVVLHAVLSGEERFHSATSLRLLHGLARMGAAVAVAGAGGRPAAVLAAQAATDWLAVAVGRMWAWRGRAPAAPSSSLFAAIKGLLFLGIPFAVAGLFAGLLADAEKLALGMARSIEEFAYYSVPFNAVFRLSAVAGMLAVFLMPRLAAAAAGGDWDGAARLVRRVARMTIAGMTVIVAPLIALAPELLHWWLGAAFAESARLSTRILLLGLLVNTMAYAAHAVVRARSHPSSLALLYGLELPLHVAVVSLLVRSAGIAGAALAWTLRVCLDAAAQQVLAWRALRRPILEWRLLAPFPLLLALLALCERFGPWEGLALRAGCGLALGVLTLGLVLSRQDWELVRGALPLARRS